MWWKKLLFPIKAVTFAWRFLVLLLITAYLEGSRNTGASRGRP
jgi:hypothetical protein